jgi:hypothetical protein
MTYDHWKTTEDEPSEELAQCDCCARMRPAREVLGCYAAGGLETWACADCRQDDPEAYE